MRIEYPWYEWAAPIELPESQLLDVLEPRKMEPPDDAVGMIVRALARPIGCPALKEMLRPGQKVVVISDDNTRLTPAHLILPPLLRQVEEAGVEREDVLILIGYGTHRRLAPEERRQKLGREVSEGYRVEDHDAWDTKQLRFLGTTEHGTEIWINRLVAEADFVIGLGNIIPHPLAGFSGGGKILQPGVCGEQTTAQTHWSGLKYKQVQLLGDAENPVRQEINRVALQAGLRFIVNSVQDPFGTLVAVVAGHPVQAWLKGCAVSRQVCGVRVPELADIAITDTHPADIDVWQCQKGISIAASVVRPGGTLIALSPCPDGVAAQYPDVARVGPRPVEFLDLLVKRVGFNPMAALPLVRLHEATSERVVMFISPGIDEATCVRLGMVPYRDPQQALADAIDRHGQTARIRVVRHAAELLPLR